MLAKLTDSQYRKLVKLASEYETVRAALSEAISLIALGWEMEIEEVEGESWRESDAAEEATGRAETLREYAEMLEDTDANAFDWDALL